MACDDLSDSLDKRSLRRYIYITGMKSGSQQDATQAMQRVRVGLTGLVMVLVLIGLASAIFTSASRDGAVIAAGASNAAVVANMTEGNVMAAAGKDEPLAALGVAPSTTSTEAVNAAEIAKRLEAQRAAETQTK